MDDNLVYFLPHKQKSLRHSEVIRYRVNKEQFSRKRIKFKVMHIAK